MAPIRVTCVSWLGNVHRKQLPQWIFFLIVKTGCPLAVKSVPGLPQQTKNNFAHSSPRIKSKYSHLKEVPNHQATNSVVSLPTNNLENICCSAH